MFGGGTGTSPGNEWVCIKNKRRLWWLALPIGIAVLWFGFCTYLNIIDPPLYDEYPRGSKKNEVTLYNDGCCLFLADFSIWLLDQNGEEYRLFENSAPPYGKRQITDFPQDISGPIRALVSFQYEYDTAGYAEFAVMDFESLEALKKDGLLLTFGDGSLRVKSGRREEMFSYDKAPWAEEGVSEPKDSIEPGNPIDRAFSKIADERGDELRGSAIFAYLYALKWYEEYQSLLAFDSSVSASETWNSYLYSRKIMEAAFAYAEKRGGSNKAGVMFAEVARYYKMLAGEVLTPSDGIIMQTNEEELYRFLSEANYSEYIPYDYYDGFYMHEYSSDERNPMVICADLRDRSIHLAFAPPFGAVLSVNNNQYFFAWSNGELTPRRVLPQLYLSDYNADGTEELAVILYVGSGTGMAVTELHVVDIYGDMSEIAITQETIEKLLFYRLSANYDPLAEMVTVKLDNQTVDVDTSQVDKQMRKDFRGLDIGSIIYFGEENGGLKVHIAMGLSGFDWATPFGYVDFYADIVLDEAGNISLSNCYIEQNAEPGI